MKKLIPLFILFALLLTGCGEKTPPPAEFDVTGTWEFRMSERDQQDVTYDTGTITFTGEKDGGEFTLISENGLEISGIYIVSGIAFSFETDQDFVIQGSFPDEDNLFGTWEVTRNKSGLWTAKRQ
ncbi:MAG: hypothetical protein GY755_01145 [Chloroflexi bacterium]|nr:hypothetical protein [Chloroflexota bacterium]